MIAAHDSSATTSTPASRMRAEHSVATRAQTAAIAPRARPAGPVIRRSRSLRSRSTTVPVATDAASSAVMPSGSGVPAPGAQHGRGQS